MSERRDTHQVTLDGTAKLAESLGPQLGSDFKTIAKGERDINIFAYIGPGEHIALVHFGYRGDVDKNRYFKYFTDTYKALSQSVEGKGSKRTIDALMAASGSRMPEVVKQPNVLARNIWNRDWEEKAQRDGKVVVK